MSAGRRRWPALLVCVATIAALAGLGWQPILTTAGGLLVAEDALTPVDTIIVSLANTPGDALEAARLYRERLSARISFATWAADPIEDEIRKLGLPGLTPAQFARQVLERSGVPASAIEELPGEVDGTETEVSAVAAFARQRHLASLLFIAPRTHTARARWLLRHELPAGTRIAVHSPRTDPFSPQTWWRTRTDSREVAMEYLRWFNTLILRDLWKR